MKKNTPVNWLKSQVKKKVNGLDEKTDMTILFLEIFLLFEQAKTMEKEQIEQAYSEGKFDQYYYTTKESEQYYNETYNTDTP